MTEKKSPKSSLRKSVFRIPWWISVLLAIGTYCTLKYVIPDLQPTNSFLDKLRKAAPFFAPLATIPFLLLAAKQLYDSDIGEEEDDKSTNSHEEDSKE